MEIYEALKHLGLNEKQAKVYVAVLQLGSGSVPAISVKAGTKRPTTYLILEELRMKGLVKLLPKKGESDLYGAVATDPLAGAEGKRRDHPAENA